MIYDWKIFNKIGKRLGNSFYILDINKFRNNYKKFRDSFRSIYKNTNIAYSYKTNYIPLLCKTVNSMGGYAEVVSIMEYDLATTSGVQPENIIFNGPYKTEAHIEKAVMNDSIVNLDSSYEIETLEKISNKYNNKKINVGIRCNFALKKDHFSRFGFDVDQPEFENSLRELKSIDNCNIIGLHCHYSTDSRSIESFRKRSKKMIQLSNEYSEYLDLKFIDLGGGYFSNMDSDLKSQFSSPIPSFEDYANTIATIFRIRYGKSKKQPLLILEPGTALVADTMKFVTKVMDIKNIRNKKISLVSGSIYNIKPTLNDKNLPMSVYKRNNEKQLVNTEGYIEVAGYTCKEDDYLYKNYNGSIEKGDYLVFDNVGAYTNVLKPPFILPNVPIIVIINQDPLKYEIIKRKENFKDVFSTYKI